MPRTFVSPNGYSILVGKNRFENEELTFRVAQAHDFWFHARDNAGAHVIMQWNPTAKEEPTMQDFQFAADIAAYYCKKPDTRIMYEVILARGCDIEKPKHGRTGQVVCEIKNVLMGCPSRFREYTNS